MKKFYFTSYEHVSVTTDGAYDQIANMRAKIYQDYIGKAEGLKIEVESDDNRDSYVFTIEDKVSFFVTIIDSTACLIQLVPLGFRSEPVILHREALSLLDAAGYYSTNDVAKVVAGIVKEALDDDFDLEEDLVDEICRFNIETMANLCRPK